MNKFVKGSIAGAAGIALLLGGAGTFALWNDAAEVNGGTVTTGNLDISTTGSGVWADISKTPATTFAPASQRIVPGDTVTFTQSVSVAATGKNLVAELSFDPTSIDIPTALQSHVDVELTATKTSGDASITAATADDTFTIVPDAVGGVSVFQVVITIVFDHNTDERDGVNAAIDLTETSYTLVQVRP